MKYSPLFFGIIAIALTSCEPPEELEETEEQAATPVETEVINVTPQEAQKLLAEDKAIVVLDVRTPEEFAEGHIEGATNLDFKNDQFAEGAAKLNPEATYLLHCRSGSRSTQSLPILKGVSLKKVYHLDSGFNGWEEAGLPVAK